MYCVKVTNGIYEPAVNQACLFETRNFIFDVIIYFNWILNQIMFNFIRYNILLYLGWFIYSLIPKVNLQCLKLSCNYLFWKIKSLLNHDVAFIAFTSWKLPVRKIFVSWKHWRSIKIKLRYSVLYLSKILNDFNQ